MDLLLKLFGIERASGVGTAFWLTSSSPALVAGAAGLLLIAALFLHARTLKGLPTYKQAAVLLFRGLLLSTLALLLLEPSVVLLSPVHTRDKLGVLIDASRSMSITPKKGEPSRWQKAIYELEEGALSELEQKYDLEYYLFGADLLPLPDLKAARAMEPIEEETDLGEAIQTLAREGRDLALGGILVLSDGIDRGRLRRSWKDSGEDGLARALEPFDLPIHALDPGEDDGLVDLSIEDLSYNEFAFLRQPFKVRATLRARNLAGTATKVVLMNAGRNLGVQRVVIPADGEPLHVEFEINPVRVGKFTYTIQSPVLPNEAVVENNRRSFTLKVVRDKIRVLQVAGAPSWDVKFLRRLLKSDPNIDLVSFFILRGPSDGSLFHPDEYSLIEFPYRDLFDREKDLSSFDVVVFQNFAYGPYLRDQSYRLLKSLADFVRDGGGLAMLGGEQAFAAGDYAGTPLEEVLPVKMDRAPSVVSLPVKFKITPQGLRHPVTILHFDPKQNRESWDHLPTLDGYNPTSATADAVVLGTLSSSPEIPLLAVREVGKGRTMALMTDTSWYWSFKAAGEGHGNLSYLRFWKNTLRWLVGDPDEQQIQVDTERENYRLGEEAVIRVNVAGADYGPLAGAHVSLEVFREDGKEEGSSFKGDTSVDGELLQRFLAERAGPYRVRAKVSGRSAARGTAETVFTVSAEGPEMKELVVDRAFLEALCKSTGGALVSAGGSSELAIRSWGDKALSQRTVVPLWDKFPPYLLLLGLLCGDWWLRRRWGIR